MVSSVVVVAAASAWGTVGRWVCWLLELLAWFFCEGRRCQQSTTGRFRFSGRRRLTVCVVDVIAVKLLVLLLHWFSLSVFWCCCCRVSDRCCQATGAAAERTTDAAKRPTDAAERQADVLPRDQPMLPPRCDRCRYCYFCCFRPVVDC